MGMTGRLPANHTWRCQSTPGPGRRDAGHGIGPVMTDVEFDGGSLHRVRAVMTEAATHAGLTAPRLYDVVVAVHELAANAVSHGAGHGRLRLWIDGAELCCQVTDDGAPGDHPATGEDPWPVKSGHGLWLARQVADRFRMRRGPGGTVATLSFSIGSWPGER